MCAPTVFGAYTSDIVVLGERRRVEPRYEPEDHAATVRVSTWRPVDIIAASGLAATAAGQPFTDAAWGGQACSTNSGRTPCQASPRLSLSRSTRSPSRAAEQGNHLQLSGVCGPPTETVRTVDASNPLHSARCPANTSPADASLPRRTEHTRIDRGGKDPEEGGEAQEDPVTVVTDIANQVDPLRLRPTLLVVRCALQAVTPGGCCSDLRWEEARSSAGNDGRGAVAMAVWEIVSQFGSRA